jgi:hypothetical protein
MPSFECTFDSYDGFISLIDENYCDRISKINAGTTEILKRPPLLGASKKNPFQPQQSVSC